MAPLVSIQIHGLAPLVARYVALGRELREAGGFRVGNRLPYARFVHDGTRPHLIRPRQAGALFWPGAAHPVRVVHHPGYKGNPYLTEGAADAEPAVRALLGTRLVAAAEGRGGSYTGALAAAGKLVQTAARARANARSGALRRDIFVEPFRRG